MAARAYCAAFAILVLAFNSAACGPVGWTRLTVNRPLKPQDVAFITPGRTTWNEVIEKLGVPNQLLGIPDGMVANYYYFDGKDFSVDLGWPLNFVGPLSFAPHSMTLRNAALGMDKFEVAFDSKGVVTYAAFSHRLGVSQYKAWPFETKFP